MLLMLANMFWRPAIPLWQIGAAAALLAALAIFTAVRAWPASKFGSVAALVVRLGAIAALTLLLLGWSTQDAGRREPAKTPLMLLVDTSASMQTPDVDGGPRIDAARERWLNAALLAELAKTAELRLLHFDETLAAMPDDFRQRPADRLAAGDATRLGRSVTQALAQLNSDSSESHGSLVVISDGRDTSARSVMQAGAAVQAAGLPVHTVTLGGASLQRDVALTALPAQDYVFAGETGRIDVTVLPSNAGRQQTTLHIDQGDSHQTRDIRIDGDEPITLSIDVSQDTPGVYEYALRLDPVEGEHELANNRQSVFVDVTADRMRVLLLEGEPYWDTKFLAQSLRMDGRIELVQLSQLTDRRRQQVTTRRAGDATLPQTLDQWLSYEAVVLGRHIERVLSQEQLQQLTEYVARGGHVIFARGPATPAADSSLNLLEPVVTGEQQPLAGDAGPRVVPTPIGRTHPAFTSMAAVEAQQVEPPRLGGLWQAERVKAGSRVIAETDAGEPAIVTMPFGAGGTAMVLVDDLWKWSLFDRRQHNLTGLYDTFWSNLLRSMVLGDAFQPGADVALQLSQRTMPLGAALDVDVATRRTPVADAQLHLSLVGPLIDAQAAAGSGGSGGAGESLALTPLPGQGMRARATIKPQKPGLYELRLDAPQLTPKRIVARFNVYDLDVERLNIAADPTAMAYLSHVSTGVVLDPQEPEQLLDMLRRERASRVEPGRAEYAWDHGWLMTLVLCWMGLEWLIRRRSGLW